MRFCTYRTAEVGPERVGLVSGEEIHGLEGVASLLDLLGDDGEALERAGARALADPFEVVRLDEAHLLPPVPRPPSIRDFMAFEEHVVTSSAALGQRVEPVWYEQPIFYFTNPAATRGAYDEIAISPGSRAFDYELEVAVVIGRGGSDISPADADRHVAGYLLLCDWSARDLQSVEMRGNLGPAKGKDSATSLGPFLVTPDELAPRRAGSAFDIELAAYVNGRRFSGGNLSSIYWRFSEMIAYASRGTELRAGDIIGSGTVGTGCILELSRVHGESAFPWLVPGDVVRLEGGVLGAIESRIVAGRDPIPLR